MDTGKDWFFYKGCTLKASRLIKYENRNIIVAANKDMDWLNFMVVKWGEFGLGDDYSGS